MKREGIVFVLGAVIAVAVSFYLATTFTTLTGVFLFLLFTVINIVILYFYHRSSPTPPPPTASNRASTTSDVVSPTPVKEEVLPPPSSPPPPPETEELISLRQKLQEAKQQTTTFADTKRAMLNIMEDLNIEKAKVEVERAKDEAILADIGEGIIVTDKVGKMSIMNQAAELMLGIEKSEMIDQAVAQVFSLIDEKGVPIPKEKEPIGVTLATGEKLTVNNYYYLRPDKTKLAIGVTATPVILNGETIGAIAVFRDITKEREVDRMKTEFISLASHQLRTPLSAIKWFTEMLLNGDAGQLTTEQSDFAKNISDSAERMIQLVNSLLNISRIESGRIIIDPRPTDLKELIQGIVIDLKAKIEEKGHKLIVSVHDSLPKINLDPRLIGQVYLNLLTNAIKYTPKGGEISVFVSKKGEEVVSQVSDNGYGIPKKDYKKVFQKFFRAENIIKVETDGTGLGLYLIKAVIESSNGKIWFNTKTVEESKDGHGTSFLFSLPLTGMTAKAGEVTLDA